MEVESKQRRWQKARAAENGCIQCGRARTIGVKGVVIQLCASCRDKRDESKIRYYQKVKQNV